MNILEPLIAEFNNTGKLILNVKVIPKSSRNQIAGFMSDGTLKVKIAAPPEKGKANAELCSYLARHFSVPKNSVTVQTGAASQRKRIRILA